MAQKKLAVIFIFFEDAHGLIIEVDKIILFLKHKSSQKPQLRRNPTVLNDVQIQNNTQHSPRVYHQQDDKESTTPALHCSSHAGKLRKKSRSAEIWYSGLNHNMMSASNHGQDQTEVFPQCSSNSHKVWSPSPFSPCIASLLPPPLFFLIVAHKWVICHCGVTGSSTQSGQVPH